MTKEKFAGSARAIKALLEPVGLGHLFTDAGPTTEMLLLRLGDNHNLYPYRGDIRERDVLVRIALDLWDGTGDASISHILSLSGQSLHIVLKTYCELRGYDRVDELWDLARKDSATLRNVER